MSTAASLAELLRIEYDKNFYTLQQTFYSNRYTALSAKVTKLANHDEKWNEAYDKALCAEKDLKIGSKVIVHEGQGSEALAKYYADLKEGENNTDLLYELTDLSNFYESMKESTETLLTQLRAQEESAKNLTAENARNTGLVSGGS